MTAKLPISMIFVCGPEHSGTSLLTAMLGAHPLVYSINVETKVFAKLGRNRISEDMVYERLLSYVPDAQRKNAQFLCEKTPNHVRVIDLIRRLFPTARIVTIVRDPRDACPSLKAREGGRLMGNIKVWLRSAGALQAAVKDPACDIVLIRYEDLIADAERALRAVCDYVGIPYSETMLCYFEDDRIWNLADDPGKSLGDHRALRNWQVHQPLMDNRGKWKNQLSDREKYQIEVRCRELMSFFGYEPETLAPGESSAPLSNKELGEFTKGMRRERKRRRLQQPQPIKMDAGH